MKALLWIGLVVLVLGIASLFLSVPQRERHGVEIGGASVGVETTQSRRLPVWASAVMMVGGISMMLASRRSRA